MSSEIYDELARKLSPDAICDGLLQVEQAYPQLFAQIVSMAAPDESNSSEILDYTLYLLDAHLKLQDSPLQQNPLLAQLLHAFPTVERSYAFSPQLSRYFHLPAQPFTLQLDTVLWITLCAIMAGLKDLSSLTAYTKYANQYFQITLPKMLSPRYSISGANFRAVMRLINTELLQCFFTNFFTRAKVATRLLPQEDLLRIQPNIASATTTATTIDDFADIATFLPCLGLEHGMILGPQPLLQQCAAQLTRNGYHFVLALNSLSAESKEVLRVMLGTSSPAKLIIDHINPYRSYLPALVPEVQSLLCCKVDVPQPQGGPQGVAQTIAPPAEVFFLSSLPPFEDSLRRLKHVVATYQQQLLKPCPFLITLPRTQEPDDVFSAPRSALDSGVAGLTGATSGRASPSASDELPQLEDFNRFVVPIMTYERDLRRFLSGNAQQEEESWEEILYRNGFNPLCSLLSLCYFFLSDVLDAQQLQQQQRSQLLNSLGDGPNLWRH